MRGKWSAEEDESLRVAVAHVGKNWKLVAPRVVGRTDAQCRERWMNVLDPVLAKKRPWSAEEDAELLAAKAEGKSWANIAREHFGGSRTDNKVRSGTFRLLRAVEKELIQSERETPVHASVARSAEAEETAKGEIAQGKEEALAERYGRRGQRRLLDRRRRCRRRRTRRIDVDRRASRARRRRRRRCRRRGIRVCVAPGQATATPGQTDEPQLGRDSGSRVAARRTTTGG